LLSSSVSLRCKYLLRHAALLCAALRCSFFCGAGASITSEEALFDQPGYVRPKNTHTKKDELKDEPKDESKGESKGRRNTQAARHSYASEVERQAVVSHSAFDFPFSVFRSLIRVCFCLDSQGSGPDDIRRHVPNG
jgi:hypothetical protein